MRGAIAAVLLAIVPRPAAAGGVEVASVGPDDAAIQWTTEEETPTRWWARAAGGDAAWVERQDSSAPSRYHVAELDGLEPGTTYEVRTTEDGPGTTLTTPEPPAGELRAMLYVLTDIHLCVEDCPSGVRRLAFSRRAYAAAMADIERRDEALEADVARAILVLGDLAQRPTADTWAAVAEPDRGGIPMCVIPGNHDGWDEHGESHLRELRERLDSPGCAYEGGHGTLDLGPWRVVLLDSSNGGANEGALGDAQRAWLDETLGGSPDRPTLLATHHPWAAHPAAFALGRDARFTYLQDGDALETILAGHPQVAAVLSGHVHVNWTGTRGRVAQLLFSALVQYPMGWHSLALYDGGFVRRFHPLAETGAESAASAEEIRRWGRSTGIPFADGVVSVVRGSLGDRSRVVATAASDGEAPGEADAGTAAEATGPADAGEGRQLEGSGAGTAAEAAAIVASTPATDGGGAPGEATRSAPSRSSGCRCAAAGAGSPGYGAWLALAAVVLWRRAARGVTGRPRAACYTARHAAANEESGACIGVAGRGPVRGPLGLRRG